MNILGGGSDPVAAWMIQMQVASCLPCLLIMQKPRDLVYSLKIRPKCEMFNNEKIAEQRSSVWILIFIVEIIREEDILRGPKSLSFLIIIAANLWLRQI